MSDCKQLEEHYEAYALGALEGEERAAVEEHLQRNCPECTQGVERARWVVSQLAHQAPQQEPPAELRERVAAIAQESEDGTTQAGVRAAVRIPLWAWAAAAALILISLYSGWQAREVQQRLADLSRTLEEQQRLNARLEHERRQYAQLRAILSAPDTRELSLKSANAALPQVRAAWNESLGLVLTASAVPAPAGDRAYQLWIVPKQGAPISAGVFRPDVKGQLLYVASTAATLAQTGALAITDEPAGGSPGPTTKPIWVAPVTSP